MKIGSKKFLAGFLAFAMLLTSVPTTVAYADEIDQVVTESEVTVTDGMDDEIQVTSLSEDDQIPENEEISLMSEEGEETLTASAKEEESENSNSQGSERTYALESGALKAFAQGAKADGDEEKAGTDNFFTLIYSAKSKVDASTKTFDDEYTSSQRINFGGAASTAKNSIKFTTEGTATVKLWWVEAGDDKRQMAILDKDGTQVAVTDLTIAKNATAISTFSLPTAGTYYLGGATNNNYIFKVEITETVGEVEKAPRADWSKVALPVIKSVTQNKGNIDVTVEMAVGYDGADNFVVTMTDADGNTSEKKSSKEGTEATVSFTPKASGTYTFSVIAARENEEDKVGEKKMDCTFVLPLTAPSVTSATNQGNGKVKIKWTSVTEAELYILEIDGVKQGEYTEEEAVVELEVDKTYTAGVRAARKTGDPTDVGTTMEFTVKAEAEREWEFTAYGSSIDTKNNGYKGSVNDGSLTVYSENGKGKIVPNSTDGLAFYFTRINPETENFTLEADIAVDSWTFSNGQEGFGIMAADAVGTLGDGSAFWNNSIQGIATKVEYYSDGNGVTTDTSAEKITMKIGIGTIAKLGVTADDVASFNASGNFGDGLTIPAGFTTETTTLETSCMAKAGTYNIIGKATNTVSGTVENPIVNLHLKIKRNNTGYYVTYSDMEGNVVGEKLIYDLDRDALTKIDSDNIYVGFFASRNAKITVTNPKLSIIAPSDDEEAEQREIEYVAANALIESATTANSKDYKLVYSGNFDGTVTVKDSKGNIIAENAAVEAGKKLEIATELSVGTTNYEITATPNANFKFSEYKLLSSYEAVTLNHSVTFAKFTNTNIYVTSDGSADGNGSKDKPVDIYTAIKYVSAGQKIVLCGGTYNLSKTVKVERGIDGTADARIYMIADAESEDRPVLDFGRNCAGMVLAGNYWYFAGFDVTNSANGQKGIQLSGSNNIIENVRAYENGNTGIQVSRYLTTDTSEYWPSNNTIKNCTSFNNADAGYEDADGFAAKLTVGEGNVFVGCIAAFNADDGWDLFAKAETGCIGKVTIENCMAFKNGYVIKEGKIVNAGNGNGFKMGGESLSGYHTLKNSVAFANKAKGIDSNSCPDIQVYDSISFDNESYNVAFYTNNAVNTDFYAENVISYKVSNGVTEQFKLKGTQDKNKVYKASNYFVTAQGESENSEGTKLDAAWFANTDVNSIVENAVTEIINHEFGLFQPELATYSENSIIRIHRDANGRINTEGFLALTEAAPETVGLYKNQTETSADTNTYLVEVTGEYSSEITTEEKKEEPGSEDKPSTPSYDVDPEFTNPVSAVVEEISSAVTTAAQEIAQATTAVEVVKAVASVVTKVAKSIFKLFRR